MVGDERQVQFENHEVGFGLKGRASSCFLLAQDSTEIYLHPSSSSGVASFLPKGEVVFKSESQELQLPCPLVGATVLMAWRAPFKPSLWLQLSE